MINPIAKEKFNRLINHNVLLVAMIVISCLQVYNYIRLNKVYCIFIFITVFVLSYQAVSQNMTISLFIAIFAANFLLGCATFLEGHTVMVHTPYEHTHGDPTDKQMIPGFDENTPEGGVAKPGEDPNLNPAANTSGEVDPESKQQEAPPGMGPAAADPESKQQEAPPGMGPAAADPESKQQEAGPEEPFTNVSAINATAAASGESFTNLNLPQEAEWPIIENSWSKY